MKDKNTSPFHKSAKLYRQFKIKNMYILIIQLITLLQRIKNFRDQLIRNILYTLASIKTFLIPV